MITVVPPYDPETHGPKRIVGPGFHERVYEIVRALPAGSVATYGDIGEALGSKTVARQVGYAMAALKIGNDVPWWRVVAAGGCLTQQPGQREQQAKLLAAEGIKVQSLRIRNFLAHRHAILPSKE
jgi:methylated-DNA-protein-cysteine methyltransferase related protein